MLVSILYFHTGADKQRKSPPPPPSDIMTERNISEFSLSVTRNIIKLKKNYISLMLYKNNLYQILHFILPFII